MSIREFESEVLRERWIAFGKLAGSDEAENLLPPPPGIYDCVCERCEVGPDEVMTAMLELVFRPVGLGPNPGRLWMVLKLESPSSVTRLRQNFAAAGHRVFSLDDLRAACDAVLGKRFFVELVAPLGGYGGSDEIAVLAPVDGDVVAPVVCGAEDLNLPFGEYEDHAKIPRFGGDFAMPAPAAN